MYVVGAYRGCCGGVASGIFECLLRFDAGFQVVTYLIPGTLVHRFFLAPRDDLSMPVRLQCIDQHRSWKWVELLDADQHRIIELHILASSVQVVIDLACAQDDMADQRWIMLVLLAICALPFLITRNTMLAGALLFSPLWLAALLTGASISLVLYCIALPGVVGVTHFISTRHLSDEVKQEAVYMHR